MNSLKIGGRHNAGTMLEIIDRLIVINQHVGSTSKNLGIPVYSKPSDIHLKLNTPDCYFNDIYQWWNISSVLQYMHASAIPITCTVSGICRNAFLMILINAKKGKRRMYEHGTIEILPIKKFGGRWSTAQSSEDENYNHRKLQDFVFRLMKTHTKLPMKEFKRLFREEIVYSAREAKKYGLIDEIIKGKPVCTGCDKSQK